VPPQHVEQLPEFMLHQNRKNQKPKHNEPKVVFAVSFNICLKNEVDYLQQWYREDFLGTISAACFHRINTSYFGHLQALHTIAYPSKTPKVLDVLMFH
jgi:hypothetical protein